MPLPVVVRGLGSLCIQAAEHDCMGQGAYGVGI